MAWAEKGDGNYILRFRIGRQRFCRTLKTESKKEADHAVSVVEENLRLLERGRLDIPPDVDVASFLLSNGKVTSVKERVKLRVLFEKYFASLPVGSLEESTLYTMRIHRNTLLEFFGNALAEGLVVQDFINERAEKASPVAIRKEVGTFRTVWSFGRQQKLLTEDFPRGLRYPKGKEKPPFMQFKDILRRGGDWECCYLTKEDLAELLRYVKRTAKHPFLYPLFMTAAYTGARRSELARARVQDISDGIITIHERKRSREKVTTRRVPLVPELRKVLREWSKGREGALFVHDGKALTRKALAHHFEYTLKDSKWKDLKGWHVFRHSFISILASDNVDQRVIDEWAGHSTEDMRRRYRHLRREPLKKTITLVFG